MTARIEAIIAVTMKVAAFWDVMSCSMARIFEDRDGRFLLNVGNHVSDFTTKHRTRR